MNTIQFSGAYTFKATRPEGFDGAIQELKASSPKVLIDPYGAASTTPGVYEAKTRFLLSVLTDDDVDTFFKRVDLPAPNSQQEIDDAMTAEMPADFLELVAKIEADQYAMKSFTQSEQDLVNKHWHRRLELGDTFSKEMEIGKLSDTLQEIDLTA